ncbi:MAG: alanyl-tRNA editing protein, partial [Spirochaetales bacterium]
MPETRKLYYDDPSAMVAEAKILEIRESGINTDIILDRTVFYPEGGGQPCDMGTMGGVSVINVLEEGLVIVHTVKGCPPFKIGDTVLMMVDAARRSDHSQQHSGQHLLSAILERNYGVHTIGFHLGATYCTIDVTCEGMDGKMIAAIEAIAEDFIAEDHPFVIHVCPPEDPQSFPLRKKLPEGEAIIRVVEIEGYDWVACCGTHVSSAAALRVL